MQFGKLTFEPVSRTPKLTAKPVQVLIANGEFLDDVFVSAIDPNLADTVAFCEAYDIPLESGANCIIVEAKRADKIWYAACVIGASDMIDVNGKVRRFLDARKISFAPREIALQLTDMEYGGVTPFGLPIDMQILVDENVMKRDYIILGSGIRDSKILAKPSVLEKLPAVVIIDIAK